MGYGNMATCTVQLHMILPYSKSLKDRVPFALCTVFLYTSLYVVLPTFSGVIFTRTKCSHVRELYYAQHMQGTTISVFSENVR